MPATPGQIALTKTRIVVFTFACLALIAFFCVYGVTGTFMRLSGDDYCYNAVEMEHGFWQTQVESYLHETVLGSNGYSLTFASSVSSELGIASSRILPGLVLILWLVGGYLLAKEVLRLLGLENSGNRGFFALETILITGIITFFTLYMAPNLGQSFYWRSGLLTYMMPLIVITYLSAFFIYVVRKHRQNWWTWIILFFMAFIGAGFSEAVTPMLLGLFSLVLLNVLALILNHQRGYRWILIPLSAVMIGTLLALATMILSPVNQQRQLSLPPPPGFVRLLAMSVENTFVFYKISLYHQLLPNVLCGLAGMAVGTGVYTRQVEQNSQRTERLPIRRITFVFTGLLIAGYWLIVCVMAPVAYGESSYPDLRTLIVPRWIMVIQISCLGWLAGWMLSRWLKARVRATHLANITALIIIIGLGVFAASVAQDSYSQIPHYQRWAVYWDMRNGQILQAKQEGMNAIHVMEIDHIIQGVGELKADPFDWYNVCAARYYGIHRIYADLPGWDQ